MVGLQGFCLFFFFLSACSLFRCKMCTSFFFSFFFVCVVRKGLYPPICFFGCMGKDVKSEVSFHHLTHLYSPGWLSGEEPSLYHFYLLGPSSVLKLPFFEKVRGVWYQKFSLFFLIQFLICFGRATRYFSNNVWLDSFCSFYMSFSLFVSIRVVYSLIGMILYSLITCIYRTY